MNIRSAVLFIILALYAVLNAAHANEEQTQDSATGRIVLSSELRGVLLSEMRSIQKGMESLVLAIASGDWQGVSQTAMKLRDSYIMKQELSEKQLEELHHALPPRFLELDRSFHHFAGMLSHVAEHGHDELVTFYFYKLSEACVACHAKYATQRFPAFAKPKERDAHHH